MVPLFNIIVHFLVASQSYHLPSKGYVVVSNIKLYRFKVILCASEHICSIVRYCFRSFKQL